MPSHPALQVVLNGSGESLVRRKSGSYDCVSHLFVPYTWSVWS